MSYTFAHGFSCWVFHQYVLNQPRIVSFFRPRWAVGPGSVLFTLALYLPYDHLMASVFNLSVLWKEIPASRRLAWVLLRGSVLSSFMFFVAYYLKQNQESQAAKLENERLKQENLKARLEVLKQQISPHFLFNSLNTLKSISQEEPVKVFTIQLAQVYRYLLRHTTADVVMVQDELAFAEAYLSIQKARFGDSIRCDIAIAPSVYPRSVLPFVIQLLLENAIKHNTATLHKPLFIRIYSEKDSLIVSNNRQPKHTVEPSTGLGLKNIQMRYETIARQKIDIIADEFTWTVKIPLLRV
ncbi:sensor histidine kinase [Larkinella punicea]|uniref:Signal transduction histidine kinase internal region domain-containing protein n=1 Tax=Larkinella punicea TaxID=2315727 RepID=A0A368JKJ8_9BACT|nr:histidine kinase [Larkinella punicea]RCR67576.1 hypothetical protein DUE52_20960 [Larkinella punicea]